MTTIDYSDDFESGMETVTIPRDWVEVSHVDQVIRYLPVAGRFDNDTPTMDELEAIK